MHFKVTTDIESKLVPIVKSAAVKKLPNPWQD